MSGVVDLGTVRRLRRAAAMRAHHAIRSREEKAEERRRAAAARRERTRFYIGFNCKGAWLGGRKYRRYAWPILFKDRALAEEVIRAFPIFANQAAMPGRGRIVSATIEKVVLS